MFKERNTTTQITTPIKDMLIDPQDCESIRLAVYHNTHKNYVAEVDFKFKSHNSDWDTDTVKLRNDLYNLENIRYKLPSGWTELQPWYEHAVQRAKQFSKDWGGDYHCKLGKKFERWHTIPLTFFSYAPEHKLALLQFSIPTGKKVELFEAHTEIELELKHSGASNIFYNTVDADR